MTITPEKKEPGKMESVPVSTPPSEAARHSSPYREDQGRHARMAAFWTTIFFVGFGCRFLHDVLVRWPSLRQPLGGFRIPIVGVDVTIAFLVSMGIFCVGVVLVRRWQQRPKVADLLIDTEAELKKVTWPKAEEVWNASIVVIVSVIIIGILLAIADMFLFRLMRAVILGSA